MSYYFDTFTKSAKPLRQVGAETVEGDKKPDIVYLYEGAKPKSSKKKTSISYEEYCATFNTNLKGRKRQDAVNTMENALLKGLKPEDLSDDDMKIVFKEVKKGEEEKGRYDTDGILFPVVDKGDVPSIFYIFGSTGSGKSYLARKIIEQYHRDFPKNDVFIISQLDSDKTLDSLGYVKRLDVEGFVSDPIDFKDFSNCLVLLDDFEVFEITNKKVYNAIIGVLNGLVSMGRHKKVSTILCVHKVSNYMHTRLVLEEANWIVIYPRSCSTKSLKYLLGHHCGMTLAQITEVKNSGSRYVCVYRHNPHFLLSEHQIKLI